MRQSFSCPDLGLEREPGAFLPIHPLVLVEFPECPAAYLRRQGDVVMLRTRHRVEPFAPHLIGGIHHPGDRVSEVAFEVEAGARNIDTVTPKMREGVHLWFREKAIRDTYDAEARKAKH